MCTYFFYRMRWLDRYICFNFTKLRLLYAVISIKNQSNWKLHSSSHLDNMNSFKSVIEFCVRCSVCIKLIITRIVLCIKFYQSSLSARFWFTFTLKLMSDLWFWFALILTVALTKITPLAGVTAASTSSIHSFPGELEELQSVLHFPEEVALRITDAEYQLFYQVKCYTLFARHFKATKIITNSLTQLFTLCWIWIIRRNRFHLLNTSNMWY